MGTADCAVNVSSIKAQLKKGNNPPKGIQVMVKGLIGSIDHDTIQQKGYQGIPLSVTIEVAGARDNGKHPSHRGALFLERGLGINLV